MGPPLFMEQGIIMMRGTAITIIPDRGPGDSIWIIFLGTGGDLDWLLAVDGMVAAGGVVPPVIAHPTVIGMAVDPGRTDTEGTTVQMQLLTEITTLICGQTTMFIGTGMALSKGM